MKPFHLSNKRKFGKNSKNGNSKKKDTIENYDNTQFQAIGGLVEGQPTKGLRKHLIQFCDQNLKTLKFIHSRALGLAKIQSNKNHIPTSIQLNSTLKFPEGLKEDQAMIEHENK